MDFDDIDDNLLRTLPLDFPFEDEDLADNTDTDTDSGIACVETSRYILALARGRAWT